MPWTLDIQRDLDKADVGSVAATFVEQGTTEPIFTKSKRIRLTVAERNAFFAEAYSERDAWRTRMAWETSNESSAATLMNNNDPNPTI